MLVCLGNPPYIARAQHYTHTCDHIHTHVWLHGFNITAKYITYIVYIREVTCKHIYICTMFNVATVYMYMF